MNIRKLMGDVMTAYAELHGLGEPIKEDQYDTSPHVRSNQICHRLIRRHAGGRDAEIFMFVWEENGKVAGIEWPMSGKELELK